MGTNDGDSGSAISSTTNAIPSLPREVALSGTDGDASCLHHAAVVAAPALAGGPAAARAPAEQRREGGLLAPASFIVNSEAAAAASMLLRAGCFRFFAIRLRRCLR